MLRKGPEQIPDSWLVLLIAVVLMQVTSVAFASLIDSDNGYSHLLTFVTNIVGVGIYATVLLATGYIRRFVPVVASVIACGSILTLFFISTYVVLHPLFGPNLALACAALFIIWSVPVEGHIIARGIGQHWYVGIVIAMIVFTAQSAVQWKMTGRL